MTKIVLSTDRPNLSQLALHNRRKDFEHALDIMGLRYEACQGVWEGETEQSYLIHGVNMKQYTQLLDIAFNKCDQEAVLRISGYGGAVCRYSDGSIENLGKWTEVDEKPTQLNYTQSFLTGKYYICL